MLNTSQELIVQTWFGELNTFGLPNEPHKQQRWFKSNTAFDRQLQLLFTKDLIKANQGKYTSWLETSEACTAFILLTDQIPRNIFRGEASAYAFEHLALNACLSGLRNDFDLSLPLAMRLFFYMPLEHSEKLSYQELCLSKMEKVKEEAAATENSDAIETIERFLQHSQTHLNIIKQFGRFPHRNKALQRESTPEEEWFLNATQNAFGQ